MLSFGSQQCFNVQMYRKYNAKRVQPIKATATEAPPAVHSKKTNLIDVLTCVCCCILTVTSI